MTMLWVNGKTDHSLADGHAFYHAHPFNVGQHVAHNEMLDECVRRGVDWHIRVDDDCWITTRTWLKRLLSIQDQLKTICGSPAVLGIDIQGLDNPPQPITRRTHGHELKGNTVLESMGILGGIFRMSPMPFIRYFRWDERQAMGFGDATQFASFCNSAGMPMFRVRNIHATHGGSTRAQALASVDWDYEHDMLQYMPLGL
jgi:hypothetical protein